MTNSFDIAFGCVTDTKGPFVEQAARLLLSLRWFGGSVANCPFILAVVGELNTEQSDFFKRHNAQVVGVEPFDDRHGPSNKLRFFDLEVLDQFTHIALLDCDTIIVQDPSEWLKCDGFAAKPADLPTVSVESLSTFLEERGLEVPSLDFHHDVADVPALPYFNSGAIILNAQWRAPFIEAWKKFDIDLIESAEQFGIPAFHVDQASLTAAVLEIGLPVKALPSCMNLPAHLAAERYNSRLLNCDPAVIHYHGLTDTKGYIKNLPLPRAQLRADAFNARLRAQRFAFELIHTDTASDNPKVVVGTGWWSTDQDGDWNIGSSTTRSVEFFHLWYRQVSTCLRPEKIIVTDSNSPNKPEVGMYRNVEWVVLDRNYGHANDIRVGKIATHWCGWTRSVINGAMYALCCDADFYVYVEQDCLIRGQHFLSAAIGDRTQDIFLGSRTQNGVGIEGKTAAPMYQNSLMIVRNEGLPRFIQGIMASEESDGEVSPEVKLEKHCAPFGELAVPFGRSRPIDFSRSHFYLQHLHENELDEFVQTETLQGLCLRERRIFQV